MKRYFVGQKEITEQEAKELEQHRKEVIRRGTIKELLALVPIKVVEEKDENVVSK